MATAQSPSNASSGRTIGDYHIVPAEHQHLLRIMDIFNHWIVHSTANFMLAPADLSEIAQTWKTVVDEQKLPYLVALDNDNPDKVLGMAHAKQYHPRQAYAATVEITVYLAPSTTGRGVGRSLLRELIDQLRRSPATAARPHGVREALAGMTADDRHPMDLEKFYGSEGFEKVGHIKRAGFKFDRWIDVAWWQMSLGNETS